MNDEHQKFQSEVRAGYRDREQSKGFQALHLAAELARLCPALSGYQVALDASQLVKLAASLSTLAVHDCNVGLNARQEANREKLAGEVVVIARFYGLKAETSGDPRGCVVRLHGDGIAKNGWGDGFGL